MKAQEFDEIKNEIIRLCNEVGFSIKRANNQVIEIFTDHSTGLHLVINLETNTKYSYHFLQRTYDIVYDGDRSDIHVFMSLIFSAFLRLSDQGVTCSLYDIPHSVPYLEDEIWGRYIIPEQDSYKQNINSTAQLIVRIKETIITLVYWRDLFWNIAGCPCKDCQSKIVVNQDKWEKELTNLIGKTILSYPNRKTNMNYGGRHIPNFKYVYDIKNELTVILSHDVSNLIDILIKSRSSKSVTIEGVNGRIFIDGELKNYSSHKSIRKLSKTIKQLFGEKKDYSFYPMENMIIATSSPYIIGLGRLGGLSEYNSERELLRTRHNKEADILFPITKFEWKAQVCPEQFEKMIKKLLEREPNVNSVRIPAPINQGDKGRDLIIEWSINDESVISEEQIPKRIIKVVGQCKSSAKTIGKGKVLDIRDTLETHNSLGFFLAVNTQISAPLTEKLEDLKSKGIWTSWWNREDIESRLLKNIDVIPNFPKVLKPIKGVKFVEE